MMTEAVVLKAIDARGVATVTLNRPRVNNAYNGDMIASLLTIFGELAADNSVRVVVLRGNGPHFQAGADLKWIDEIREQDRDENLAVSRRTAQAVRGLNEFPKPTMALVHGGCFGGGIGVLAACDVVIAEDTSLFAITEARWGLMASIIIPQLNGAIGLRQVRRYALSCERFGAQRAYEMGLVHEVCAEGALDSTAAATIDAFLISAPDAMAGTKALALAQASQIMDEAYFEDLIAVHSDKRISDEAIEGLASFREKRDPDWYPGKAE
jgi:methylglutaconyl-CoA hydratase